MRGEVENGRRAGGGWLATTIGVVVLVTAGFALGLIVGVVSEEPELVVGHMAGRSTEVAWDMESEATGGSGSAAPGVAAPRLVPERDDSAGASPPDVEEPTAAGDGESSRRAPTPETAIDLPSALHRADSVPDVSVAARLDAGPAKTPSEAELRLAADAPSQPLARTLRDSSSGRSPKPTLAARSTSGPIYAVQVGAFLDGDAAESVATQLESKGFEVNVLEPTTDARWRVRVGPVDSRGEADALARRLKSEERLPTWVLKERPR